MSTLLRQAQPACALKRNSEGLLPGINVVIAAFYQAMIDKDMLNNMKFVVMGEFDWTSK